MVIFKAIFYSFKDGLELIFNREFLLFIKSKRKDLFKEFIKYSRLSSLKRFQIILKVIKDLWEQSSEIMMSTRASSLPSSPLNLHCNAPRRELSCQPRRGEGSHNHRVSYYIFILLSSFLWSSSQYLHQNCYWIIYGAKKLLWQSFLVTSFQIHHKFTNL